MASAPLICTLAQAPPQATFDPTGVVIAGVAIVVAGIVIFVVARRYQANEFQRLLKFADRYGFTRIEPESPSVEAVRPLLADVLRADWTHAASVDVQYAARGASAKFSVLLLQIRLFVPVAQGESFRLVLVCQGFDGRLPAFDVQPNNWMIRKIHGATKNCAPYGPFAEHNYVRARDRSEVRSFFHASVQQLLLDNRNLAVVAGGNMLGVYDHGRVQPRNLDHFLETAITLATLLREKVDVDAAHAPDASSGVVN